MKRLDPIAIRQLLAFILLACAASASPARATPHVTNVRASQRQDGSGLVDIHYDLADGVGTMTVSVAVSPDDGMSWSVLPSPVHLWGDVGPGVSNGANRHIVWNAGVERPDVYWPQCRVRVTAVEELTIYLPGGVPLVFVRIPAGRFDMGSTVTERSRYLNEDPLHPVSIARDFYMGKYEVTQRQWLALMGTWPGQAPSPEYGLGDDYPAYFISWSDTASFIAALNDHITSTAQGPLTARLPSEAEWEYACRAASTTRFYFGESLTVDDLDEDDGLRSQYMWFGGNNDPFGTKPVGRKLPNAWGLYDMHGNVWEWCEDWYHSSYIGAPADGSAWVEPPSSLRVIRGGSWYSNAVHCRSANRFSGTPTPRSSNLGLRLAARP